MSGSKIICIKCNRKFPDYHRPIDICQKCSRLYKKEIGLPYNERVDKNHSFHAHFFKQAVAELIHTSATVEQSNPLLDWVVVRQKQT